MVVGQNKLFNELDFFISEGIYDIQNYVSEAIHILYKKLIQNESACSTGL